MKELFFHQYDDEESTDQEESSSEEEFKRSKIPGGYAVEHDEQTRLAI